MAAVEVLVNTPAVSNMIREGNEHQLYTAMQTGRAAHADHGQLFGLPGSAGVITKEDALARSVNKSEVERALR